MSVVTFCFSLSWQSSPYYTIIRLVCNIIPSIISLILTFLGKRLLDLLSGAWKTDQPTTALLSLFTLMLGLSLARLISAKLSQYSQTVHDDAVNSRVNLTLMDKGLRADMEHFDNPEFYNKLTAATRDSYEITRILWHVVMGFSAAVTFIAAFSILSSQNMLYGWLLLLAGVPSSIAGVRYTNRLYQLSLSQIEGERQKGYISSLATERSRVQAVRLYDLGNLLKNKYSELWLRMFRERKNTLKIRGVISGLLECLPEITVVYIGFDVSLRVLNGRATIGDYSLYTGLAFQLLSGIYMLSNSFTQIYESQLKINNFRSLEQIEKRVPDTGTRECSKIETIAFEHVTFVYPGTDKTVLSDINFKIGKNEKIALVGLNGSGKSTLIKLLMRFYDVSGGSIKINGTDLREYRIDAIRENFSVYFQDDLNYCFTLRENIAIADADARAGDPSIRQALAESGGDAIMQNAPQGLDTYLSRAFSEEGLELSGGQNQKIALARTFFRRHTALVLDEPSSSLDPQAEHELFEKLKHFTNDKTTIFTSHRLSNVFLADRVIVLEAGGVIEIGTQNELLKQEGRFSELFRYQKNQYNGENNP